MIKSELISLIEKDYFTKNNNINSKKILINETIYKELMNYTNFLSEDTNLNERYFCLKNNIKEKPTCLNSKCNNQTAYKNNGYKLYCSDTCFVKDSKTNNEERLKRYKVQELISKEVLTTYLKEKAIVGDNKRISTGFVRTFGLDKVSHSYFYYLFEYTKFLNKQSSILERIYCLLNNIVKKQKCTCGKDLKFVTYKSGYNTFCSPKCGAKYTKEKREETNIEKYGTKNIFGSKDFKENNKKYWNEKHGIDNPSQLDSIKKKKENTSIKNWGTSTYTQSEDYKIKTMKKNYKEKMELLKDVVMPLFSLDDYNGVTNKNNYLFQCARCNYKFYSTLDNGNIPRCYKCYPKRTSYFRLEKEVSEWLSSIGFHNKINSKFYLENSRSFKELDIFIPDHNLGIEINGIYWHSEISGRKDRNYHINKQDFFRERNITTIQILDKEWIEQKELVKSIILSKLGKFDIKIGARKCIVKEIDNTTCNQFLLENHLQGKIESKINLGLYYRDNLVQVLTISKARMNKKYEYEITRFCSLKKYCIMGGFSKLLSYFERYYKPKSIITYADYRISLGKIYYNNGFVLERSPEPNYYYINKKNYNVIFNRIKFQKHKLKDLLDNFQNTLSEWDNMKYNNYDRIWDCGSFTFIKTY